MFTKDGALFIDGESGKIMADGYFIDLRHRDADQNGGSGHKKAMHLLQVLKVALQSNALRTVVSLTEKERGNLNIFPGTREPTKVPVRPAKYTNTK